MKVSIIVPVYNAENYLKRCIESLLQQTYENIEVIIINDGSTDSSSIVIDYYSDKRIVKKTKKNSGVSDARNKGIEIATGEYIAFIDADDYIEKNYIEKMLSTIVHSNCDLVCCGYSYVNSNDIQIGGFPLTGALWNLGKEGYLSKEDFLSGMLLNNSICSGLWNKLFKREVIGNIRFACDISIGEDLLFIADYISKCETFYFVPDKLYNYMINPNGAMKCINYAKEFNMNWLSEWRAIIRFEEQNQIHSSRLKMLIQYKKMIIANKILSKAKKCSYWSEECGAIKNYIVKNRKYVFCNKFLNTKVKMKLFIY